MNRRQVWIRSRAASSDILAQLAATEGMTTVRRHTLPDEAERSRIAFNV